MGGKGINQDRSVYFDIPLFVILKSDIRLGDLSHAWRISPV